MFVEVRYNSKANITFHDMAKVSIRGDQNYLVKWYQNDEFFGEMFLNGGTWGAYPMFDIADWKVEFWQDDRLVYTYKNLLDKQDVLILFNNNGNDFPEFVKKIKEYSNEIVNKFNCNLYAYFKNSELCDLSNERVKPLRLNDRIETFKIIYTKTL
jgi:hypothetical protein